MRQDKLPEPAVQEESKRVLEERPEVAQVLNVDTDVELGFCNVQSSLHHTLVLQRGQGARGIHHIPSRLGGQDPSPVGKGNTHMVRGGH